MRAITFAEHSPALDVYRLVEEMPAPTPGVGEVLVRVRFAALNRLDNFVRIGWKGLRLALPHIPCSDFAGEIAALGPGVTEWSVGQAVTANPLLWCGRCRACLRGAHNRCANAQILGESVAGACAEFVRVPDINLVAIPEGFDMRQAAAASLVYSTAWHSLVRLGGVGPLDNVLVIGAGGGVNTASIQIAKRMGAMVYVIAADADKAQRARALGADWAHARSESEEWVKPVYEASGRAGMDIVVDNVGAATFARSLRTLRPGGRLLTVGGSSGYEAAVPVNLLFGRHLSILGSTMGTQEDYRTVMALLFAGRLAPVVDSIYPLADFARAMQHLIDNRHFGKVLIDVNA